MKDNLKDQQTASASNEKAQPLEKRPCSSPVLQVYGTVSKLTQGNSGTGTESTHLRKTNSDPRIKENIARIGTHPLGIGLYLFDYKPEYRELSGHGRQFGVMADEVEQVMPEAVSVHPDGYKMVDYAMLGISRSPH